MEPKKGISSWTIWNKHNNPIKSSGPSKHLLNNIDHCFTWTITSNEPKKLRPGIMYCSTEILSELTKGL